uniref:Uncharacterized protein n=1 Tax=Anguilla anguilla TaxID=7936 RepID=A0A0E9TA99_ANGAN
MLYKRSEPPISQYLDVL